MTFRLTGSPLAIDEATLIRDHMKNCPNARILALAVMPDHVHIVLKPHEGKTLPTMVKGLKGSSARALNSRRGTCGVVWQSQYWDRIVRSESDLLEKMTYMLNNPMKAGLIADPWEYPGWYLSDQP